MKKDLIYEQLRERMKEVSSLPPQRIGRLTPVWKKTAPIVKNSPFKVFTLGGLATSLLLWLLLGSALVRLVNILQYGF